MTNNYAKKPVPKIYRAALVFLVVQILSVTAGMAKELPAALLPKPLDQEHNSVKRTAGPTSWVEQHSGFSVASRGIRSLDAVNENVAWAVAYDGNAGRTADTFEFTRTVNGGTTWTKGSIGNEPAAVITNISAVSATEAWAGLWSTVPTSTNKGVFHTTDGGQTWTNQTTAYFKGTTSFINWVTFIDANNGAVGGDPVNGRFEVYTTANGGQAWAPVPEANMPAALTGEYSVSDNFYSNGDNIWFGTSHGRIFRSTDKGLTWTVHTPFAENVQVLMMAFATNGSGIVVGVENVSNNLMVTRTTNRGTNWTGALAKLLGTISPNDLAYVPGTISTFVATGARAGASGSAYTRDGGESWTHITTNTQHLEVDFVSPTVGWSGAFSKADGTGGMYKFSGNLATTPSGQSLAWEAKTDGFATPSRGIRSIHALNDNVVWAVTYDGGGGVNPMTAPEFVRTTDAGATWVTGTIQGLSASAVVGNISAISAQEAFAAVYAESNTSGVYRTTNGGQTWTRQATAPFNGSTSFINWVTFQDANQGVAGGDPLDGRFEVYTTSNGGQAWTRVPQANMPAALENEYGLTNNFTRNGDNIWFGTTLGRVFKSTNKGLNWTATAPFSSNVMTQNLAFATNGTGIAIGVENGTNFILVSRTTDGGTTWSAQQYQVPGGISPNAVAWVPGTDQTFVVSGATPGWSGTAYSTDGGFTWSLLDQAVQHLEIAFTSATSGWSGGFSRMYKFTGSLAGNLTGIAEGLKTRPVQVYPNPATTQFTVSTSGLTTKNATFRLYNLSGQVVLEQPLPAGPATVNVAHLPKGMYMLHVISPDKTMKQKVVLQ